jgi:hypothetical protein
MTSLPRLSPSQKNSYVSIAKLSSMSASYPLVLASFIVVAADAKLLVETWPQEFSGRLSAQEMGFTCVASAFWVAPCCTYKETADVLRFEARPVVNVVNLEHLSTSSPPYDQNLGGSTPGSISSDVVRTAYVWWMLSSGSRS